MGLPASSTAFLAFGALGPGSLGQGVGLQSGDWHTSLPYWNALVPCPAPAPDSSFLPNAGLGCSPFILGLLTSGQWGGGEQGFPRSIIKAGAKCISRWKTTQSWCTCPFPAPVPALVACGCPGPHILRMPSQGLCLPALCLSHPSVTERRPESPPGKHEGTRRLSEQVPEPIRVDGTQQLTLGLSSSLSSTLGSRTP